jgi:RNA polymerase sigma-70 factor (ECF subfamily)
MRQLEERDRAVIVLHYYLGLPLADVAVALQIPVGTVKTRLHRALVAMRAEVGSDPESPSPVPGGQIA